MLTATLKVKACQHCKRDFMPVRPLQAVCSPICASRKVKKERVETIKANRAEDRRKREEQKKLPKLIAEAQDSFNAWIRYRDRDKGCFVCGRAFPVGQLGGDFDAGHIRSRGAAGHLRFSEINVQGECKHCNASNGAKPHQIKAGAIARIGLAAFEALENDNTPHKWDKDEVRSIRDEYRARLRQATKEAA